MYKVESTAPSESYSSPGFQCMHETSQLINLYSDFSFYFVFVSGVYSNKNLGRSGEGGDRFPSLCTQSVPSSASRAHDSDRGVCVLMNRLPADQSAHDQFAR